MKNADAIGLLLARGLLAVLGLFVTGCMLERETVSLWGAGVKSPELISIRMEGPLGLTGDFSAPVRVTGSRVFSPSLADEGVPVYSGDEASSTVLFSLPEGLVPGEKASLTGFVEDGRGNSLGFIAPFIVFNERVPAMRINEVRTAYSKPKVEFVEILVLSDGNVAGAELGNAANEKVPSYTFPSAEVRAGEYIVIHFRAIEEGLVDELSSLDESGGTEALGTARDLWDNQDRAPLKATNVLTLRARPLGPILDALLLCESRYEDWPTDELRRAAAEAASSGAWGPDGSVASAVSTDVPKKMTLTRTCGRDADSRDTGTAADWRVCADRKATPGSLNKAFE